MSDMRNKTFQELINKDSDADILFSQLGDTFTEFFPCKATCYSKDCYYISGVYSLGKEKVSFAESSKLKTIIDTLIYFGYEPMGAQGDHWLDYSTVSLKTKSGEFDIAVSLKISELSVFGLSVLEVGYQKQTQAETKRILNGE